jgi:hypothetical protein
LGTELPHQILYATSSLAATPIAGHGVGGDSHPTAQRARRPIRGDGRPGELGPDRSERSVQLAHGAEQPLVGLPIWWRGRVRNKGFELGQSVAAMCHFLAPDLERPGHSEADGEEPTPEASEGEQTVASNERFMDPKHCIQGLQVKIEAHDTTEVRCGRRAPCQLEGQCQDRGIVCRQSAGTPGMLNRNQALRGA